MTNDQANEVISILYKILDKIGSQRQKEKINLQQTVLPIEERPRTKRYPLRVDPGTVFRSRAGYNWVCPYCNKAILEGDMIIAFQPKPDTRTTYAHLSCDEEERKLWDELDS